MNYPCTKGRRQFSRPGGSCYTNHYYGYAGSVVTFWPSRKTCVVPQHPVAVRRANQESLSLNLWDSLKSASLKQAQPVRILRISESRFLGNFPVDLRIPTPRSQEPASVKPFELQILNSWIDRNVRFIWGLRPFFRTRILHVYGFDPIGISFSRGEVLHCIVKHMRL